MRCSESARRWGEARLQVKMLSTSAWERVCSWDGQRRTRQRREANFEVRMLKTPQLGSAFGSWDLQKLHAIVAGSTFRSEHGKQVHDRASFACSSVVLWGRHNGFFTVPQVWGSHGSCKNDCSRGKIQKEDAFGVAGSVQGASPSGMFGGQGIDFLRGLHFGASNPQVCQDDFARPVHFVWPGLPFFCGRRNTASENALARGSQICTQRAIFWTEASQNCFVCWQPQYQSLRKHRRISSLWSCELSLFEEVSQNCFVLELCASIFWWSLAKSLRLRSIDR